MSNIYVGLPEIAQRQLSEFEHELACIIDEISLAKLNILVRIRSSVAGREDVDSVHNEVGRLKAMRTAMTKFSSDLERLMAGVQ